VTHKNLSACLPAAVATADVSAAATTTAAAAVAHSGSGGRSGGAAASTAPVAAPTPAPAPALASLILASVSALAALKAVAPPALFSVRLLIWPLQVVFRSAQYLKSYAEELPTLYGLHV